MCLGFVTQWSNSATSSRLSTTGSRSGLGTLARRSPKPGRSRVTLKKNRNADTAVPIIAGGKARKPIRPAPILTGILASSSVWTPQNFDLDLRSCLTDLPAADRLDLGCALEHGSFEQTKKITISIPEESLIFFILRLLERLRSQGTAPAADLMKYGRHLESFK